MADIVIIGSGNLATHLSKGMKLAGHKIRQVYSRDRQHALSLAMAVDAEAITSLDEVTLNAELYLISVSDNAIGQVIAGLPRDLQGIVAHTSGSTPLDVFRGQPWAYGVFYPLQTFSKTKSVDFKQIPMAIEGQNESVTEQIKAWAITLSDRVFICDSKQRLALHVAAVFACNFSNHLYAVAEKLLIQNDLSYDLIKPLIWETAQKAMIFSPSEVQTGPAVRNDHQTMQKHLLFLKENSDLAALYETISQLITKRT